VSVVLLKLNVRAPKTHAFWNRLLKVIQCRWFCYQSKARMRLPISPS